jgi:hypothetical protein
MLRLLLPSWVLPKVGDRNITKQPRKKFFAASFFIGTTEWHQQAKNLLLSGKRKCVCMCVAALVLLIFRAVAVYYTLASNPGNAFEFRQATHAFCSFQ